MIANLENLIHALREELQQYGEMLARLDQQQECMMNRATDDVLASISAIQAQAAAIEEARRLRETNRQALAVALGLAADAPFGQILPLLPGDYRPLVEALVQENNELLVRIQHRARQNHLLFRRSIELMQRFLGNFMPAMNTTVYTGAGGMTGLTPAAHPMYQAVG